jgi:cytochrome c biogenesis protein CcmG, thiol:disulfide interchange protein DsbE
MVPVDELEGFRTKARTRKVAILALVGVAIAAAVGYGIFKPAPDSTDVGRGAPEFELELLGGGTLSSDELQGRPVVLNFFASWCVPCREEAPLFETVYRDYKDEGLQVVGVNIRDSEPDARGFIEEFEISYPVVRDPQEILATDIGVLGLPETYFIDAEYRFAGTSNTKQVATRGGTVWFGPISEQRLRESVRDLIQGTR